MKRFAAIVSSMLVPGLGQCFYGYFGWGLMFILSTCLIGPVANVLAALHVLFIDDE
jgi:TM2 domain-containing membrane protein YozV